MTTEMVWNDVAPPANAKERSAASFLLMLARKVHLQEITPQNREEWLWRGTFLKAIEFYSRYDADTAEIVSGPDSPFAGFLDRFCGVTFQDPFRACNRVEFIENVINAAQGLADVAVEENSESPV